MYNQSFGEKTVLTRIFLRPVFSTEIYQRPCFMCVHIILIKAFTADLKKNIRYTEGTFTSHGWQYLCIHDHNNVLCYPLILNGRRHNT